MNRKSTYRDQLKKYQGGYGYCEKERENNDTSFNDT